MQNVNRNYESEMQEIILKNCQRDVKPRLLLHSCCAPCSSSCLERLKEHFNLTVYYYNPNVDSAQEFEHRAQEQKKLCERLNVECVIEKYNQTEFLSAVQGLEDQPEGGSRCKECFRLRLEKTADYAKDNGFDYFTTTLSVSPLKNAKVLNQLGEQISCQKGISFLVADFKKKNGYLRSIELSKEFGLYRQNYCGCKFSKRI